MRVAIVEDEREATHLLKNALERYESETGHSFLISIFSNAEDFIIGYEPVYDIVFMDIELGGMSGIEAAEKLRKYDDKVYLLFVTSMAQYAIKAYKVNAVDYFVKPFSYFDLKMRLDRIFNQVPKEDLLIKILIRNEGTKLISSNDIYYVEVYKHMLIYHTKDGVFETRGTLKELEERLVGHSFVRCKISFLINIMHCNYYFEDTIKVGGDEIHISRQYKKEFLRRLNEVFTSRRV